MSKTQDCQCTVCQGACTIRPGWFSAGQAEDVAKYLGISLQELFDTKLAADWWVAEPSDIYVLAPALKGRLAGVTYPSIPTGECIFFEEGKCSIHEVKPTECKEYLHGKTSEEGQVVREKIVDSWDEPNMQKQINNLLGEE